MNTVEELIEEQVQLARKRLEENKDFVLRVIDAIKAFFNEHDIWIKEISWAQYTPYWNDGEECVFRMQDLCFTPTRELTEALALIPGGGLEEYYSDRYRFAYRADLPPELLPVKNDIEKLEKLLGTNQKAMQDFFGDHQLIVIDAKGNITKRQYEHD